MLDQTAFQGLKPRITEERKKEERIKKEERKKFVNQVN